MSGEYIKFQNLESPSQESLEALGHVFNQKQEWMALPFQTDALKISQDWIKKTKKFQNHLAILGIGGSHLGIEGIYDFLSPKKKITFFSNVDGYDFEKKMDILTLKRTHFLVISKSGETSETLMQLAHILHALKKNKLKFADHVSVITEEKSSSLKRAAQKWGLSVLPIPLSVGGRFSVLTVVGLAPLMWAGVNVKGILQGAQWASHLKNQVASLTDFYLETFKYQKWISVFWFYCERLKTFRHWVEQLWSESLAKKETLQGLAAPQVGTPLVCLGSNDQHSLLQQFSEGAQDKSFFFVRNSQSEKAKKITFLADPSLKIFQNKSLGDLFGIQAQATEKVLSQNGAMTKQIVLLDHSPQTIGALIFFFELLVVCLAERLNINAYNQPGVEAVKKTVSSELNKI